jgi:hypothetical protein
MILPCLLRQGLGRTGLLPGLPGLLGLPNVAAATSLLLPLLLLLLGVLGSLRPGQAPGGWYYQLVAVGSYS